MEQNYCLPITSHLQVPGLKEELLKKFGTLNIQLENNFNFNFRFANIKENKTLLKETIRLLNKQFNISLICVYHVESEHVSEYFFKSYRNTSKKEYISYYEELERKDKINKKNIHKLRKQKTLIIIGIVSLSIYLIIFSCLQFL